MSESLENSAWPIEKDADNISLLAIVFGHYTHRNRSAICNGERKGHALKWANLRPALWCGMR